MADGNDPRPLLTRALDQTGGLVASVRPEQLDGQTPCAEYDVRSLLGHVAAVVQRFAYVGRHGDVGETPTMLDGVPDDGWAAAYDAYRAELDQVWGDDSLLDGTFVLPFGTVPGRAAVGGYVMELTAHSWDLAASTGRTEHLDPELGGAVLGMAQQFLPAEPRGGDVPFGPVVPVPADADVYRQLAGWLGRDAGRW